MKTYILCFFKTTKWLIKNYNKILIDIIKIKDKISIFRTKLKVSLTKKYQKNVYKKQRLSLVVRSTDYF